MWRLNICDGIDSRFNPSVPAMLTATMFGCQRSNLRVLCITVMVSGLIGSDFAALLVLTQLRHLKVWTESYASMLPGVMLVCHNVLPQS